MLARSLIIGLALFTSFASASERHYLKRNELFCDDRGSICVRGTLSYDVNPRLLSLNARVQKAPGPGVLRIRVSGTNRLGHVHHATIESRVGGHASEIIDHRMVPDAPDVYRWNLDSIAFVPD